jgi:uncharacterized repeat protein (TIGR03803 family)
MVTVGAAAQSFTTLASFNGTNGALPQGQLVQGSDGNFYGTTTNGGAGTSCYEGCGTVFKLTPAGKLTTIHDFCNETCQDGFAPQGGLIQSANGNFYGTAGAGGNASNAGTVFEITSAGKLTTLYSFCSQPNCADGIFLFSGLVQGSDGNFYGTTAAGGANGVGLETCGSIILQAGLGCGTVFKLTARGELTTLYSFCSQLNCTDGYQPMSGLVQAADGNFYGTTYGGGSGSGLYCESGCGTIFKITPAGALTTIYNFCLQLGCTDGKSPSSNLIQASDGNFYGTNYLANTVFKITPGGELTTLYTFCALRGCPDGLGPAAALMQATDGNFYGTTEEGGTGGNNGSGTVFSITPGGALTTLYSFCSQPDCVDGASGFASLMQNTNGILYGPTPRGGSSNEGTIFSMSMGLSPFVQTQSSSGKVGATVTILGNNLTGATGVTFDGTSATITVGKASEIKAKIPTGAMTGTVKVTTPAGTLTSNVPFRVSPQFKAFTPNKGPVATQVQLSGVSLSQTTQITFDGVATNAFTVDSDSQLTATVPAGATTGKIAITTAGGTATSSAVFKVTE